VLSILYAAHLTYHPSRNLQNGTEPARKRPRYVNTGVQGESSLVQGGIRSSSDQELHSEYRLPVGPANAKDPHDVDGGDDTEELAEHQLTFDNLKMQYRHTTLYADLP